MKKMQRTSHGIRAISPFENEFRSRSWMVLQIMLIVMFAFCLTAEAQVQRMLIPSGTYHIGGGGGSGGSGRISGGRREWTPTIPSYCVDPHFAPPTSDSPYNYLVAGGKNSTVKLPGHQPIPLNTALQNGDIKIFGDDWGIDTLRVEAPEGTEIKIAGPLVLSADHWLEFTKKHKFDPSTIDISNRHLKDGQDNSKADAQRSIWKDIQMREIEAELGKEARKLVEEALKGRTFRSADISTLGESPVLRLISEDPNDVNSLDLSEFERREIIRREGKETVRRTANDDEAIHQVNNIHARLRSLSTDNTSFIASTKEGKVFFVKKGSTSPLMIENLEKNGLLEVSKWLDSWTGDGKPNIIVVSEGTFETELIVDAVREACNGRARIYEDDDPTMAVANVNAQRPIKAGKDVAIYADSTIETGGILAGLENVFSKCNIPILRKPSVVEAGNIIVVTGHKDAAYRSYLAELATRGALKGKAVALISCAEAGDREFSRFLIKEGGASCIFRINDEIDSAAAREVLVQAAELIKSLPAEGKYLDELLEDAAKAAANEAVGESFKEDIRVILDHALQVSQVLKNSIVPLP